MSLLRKPTRYGKTLNFGLQHFILKRKFPSFILHRAEKPYWIGKLKPSEQSPEYTVQVIYHPYRPQVFVLYPQILRSAPHRYSDGSLCLYHPNDRSFRGDLLISDTIVPWACEWLYFYEAWLEEGVWWGKEAPHSPLSSTQLEVEVK